jgi:hypothetical protein
VGEVCYSAEGLAHELCKMNALLLTGQVQIMLIIVFTIHFTSIILVT